MGDRRQGSSNRVIVLLELFAGLLPLATAAKELSIPIQASFAAEVSEDALTVTRVTHPSTIQLGGVQDISKETVKNIVQEHGEALYLMAGCLPRVDLSYPKTHVHETSGSSGKPGSELLGHFRRVLGLVTTGSR